MLKSTPNACNGSAQHSEDFQLSEQQRPLPWTLGEKTPLGVNAVHAATSRTQFDD
jgi:hypothetical protein